MRKFRGRWAFIAVVVSTAAMGLAAVSAGCAAEEKPAPRVMRPTPMERPEAISEGWVALFDGTDASARANFRQYNGTTLSTNWWVVDGSLTNVRNAGDIVTRERYGSFDLRFEYKVRPRGNSGVMYKVVERAGEPSYHSGPEFQVIDDAVAELDPAGKQSAGANYDIDAPSQSVSKPAGQWNRGRIVVDGSRVEHWLNGVKVVEYEIGSEGWAAKVAGSKFNEWPGYGKAERGHIAFQDHGDQVWLRDIRVRPLD